MVDSKQLRGFVTHADGKTWFYGNGDSKPTCWMDEMNKSAEESKRRRLKEMNVEGKQLTLF